MALAVAPKGAIIIFVRPENTCPEVLESKHINEIALTGAPDVGIVSDSGVFLIDRKQKLDTTDLMIRVIA
jgi:hypothetical protein